MADKPNPSRDSSRGNISQRGRALEQIPGTLEALNSPDATERRRALAEAAAAFERGQLVRPHETGWVNVLARTRASFSRDSLSPARLAWEAAIRGLSVIGCADRDSLGGLEEMLAAGDELGLRATVSLDTKVHVQEHADEELNCAGEPGVLRVLAAGLGSSPPPDSPLGRMLAALAVRADERGRALTESLNAILTPVGVDYARDVVPLAPSGTVTDEHVARAYVDRARELFPDRQALAVFWADVLAGSPDYVEGLLARDDAFIDVLLEKLLPAGARAAPFPGGGYPAVGDFFKAVAGAGAAGAVAWRGPLATRADAGKILDAALGWGARALCVRPDRFWNIPGGLERVAGLEGLGNLVRAARERGLPVLAGTAGEGAGRKFVDAFDAPELAAYSRDFTAGGLWLYGRTVIGRSLGGAAAAGWEAGAFGGDRKRADSFYLEAGRAARPGAAALRRIAAAGEGAGPEDFARALAER